jgi:hypothetical protein
MSRTVTAERIVAFIRAYQAHRDVDTADVPRASLAASLDLLLHGSADDHVQDAMRDPVRAAMRGFVRENGWAAFAAGGLTEMRALYLAVEEKAGDDDFVPGVLEPWWNGIGVGDEVWTS